MPLVKQKPAKHPDRLDSSYLELAGSDVDIEAFRLQMRDGAGIALESAITDARVSRTIQGASTLTVTVDDDLNRTIQRSGRLGRKVDVEVDGLWWTLVSVKKAQRALTLTFEEREVNLLRYYATFIKADRSKTTRAEFVLRMIKEVKEVPLQWVIPELKTQELVSDLQPNQILVDPQGGALVNSTDPQTGGIPATPITGLTVKGKPATPEQIKNANIVLSTGQRSGARTKVLICSIMTAIQESTLINLRGGDRDSVGVFQQRRSMGWPATRNVATDAAAFFKEAIQIDQQNPQLSYAMLCQSVQHSAFSDGSNYFPWRGEADDFLREYGLNPVSNASDPVPNNSGAPQSTISGSQFFTRGQISQKHGQFYLTKEDSWACMNRLAGEVNWRAFCVSGVIFFISEQWLFKSKPFMTISEDTEGIDWIDFDYDEGKREATITVTAHLSRWSAPPGSIVRIENQGIVNGKWLLNDIDRSIYETIATITLKKPLPVLPEPTALTSVPQNFFGGDPNVAGARNGGELPMNKRQQAIVSYARSQLGVPYQWGAEEAGVAFDCSGLTQAAYSNAGINIPHNAQAQFNLGPQTFGPLQPGDLVFFGSSGNIHHVGIYIGNGNMIDAPHSGSVVRVDADFRHTWPDYYGATSPWRT